MAAGLKAGLVYFVAVFGLGFVFGVLRTLALEAFPGLSRLGAVLIEVPVILAIAWVVCGVLMRRFSITGREGPAMVMGVTALLWLLVAEAGLSMGLNQLSLQAHVALYQQPSFLIGLVGQCVFAVFPWLSARVHSTVRRAH